MLSPVLAASEAESSSDSLDKGVEPGVLALGSAESFFDAALLVCFAEPMLIFPRRQIQKNLEKRNQKCEHISCFHGKLRPAY